MSLMILQAEARKIVASLSGSSNDELDAIVNDDEKLDALLQGVDQSYLKEIENEKENLLASNNSVAEFNLLKEPELVEGREKLASLYEEAERLTKAVEEKTEELRRKGGDISLETALALLQTAASEMEEESDQIAKKFLDGDSELEDFHDQFLIKRKLMHTRLVKAEKLSKILQRDPSLSNIPNYINAPPVNINSGYFPGVPNPMGQPTGPSGVPYPMGPLNMPMPGMNYFQNHF